MFSGPCRGFAVFQVQWKTQDCVWECHRKICDGQGRRQERGGQQLKEDRLDFSFASPNNVGFSFQTLISSAQLVIHLFTLNPLVSFAWAVSFFKSHCAGSEKSSENWIMHNLIVLQTINRNCVCSGSKKERSSMSTLGHKFRKKNPCAHRSEMVFISIQDFGNWIGIFCTQALLAACAHHEGMAEGRRGFGGVWLFLIPPE